MSKETIFFELLKSDTKMIVCGVNEFKEQRLFFIREMWRKDTDDVEWKFCKKIITMGYESAHALIRSIANIDDIVFSELLGGSRKLGNIEEHASGEQEEVRE